VYKSIYLLTYLLTITTHETVDGLPAAEYTRRHTSVSTRLSTDCMSLLSPAKFPG